MKKKKKKDVQTKPKKKKINKTKRKNLIKIGTKYWSLKVKLKPNEPNL